MYGLLLREENNPVQAISLKGITKGKGCVMLLTTTLKVPFYLPTGDTVDK